MNKISTISVFLVIFTIISCGKTTPDSSTPIPDRPNIPGTVPPQTPEPDLGQGSKSGPLELTSYFPESYKNSFANGNLTITNTTQQEISNIKIKVEPVPANEKFDVQFGITGNNLQRGEDFSKSQGTYPGLAGTCPKDGSLSPGGACMVDLTALTGRKVDRTIVRLLTVSFSIDGKPYTQQVKLSIFVKDRKELFPRDVKLGQTPDTRSKAFFLTNLSNLDEVTDIKIEPVIPGLVSAFELSKAGPKLLKDVTSSCLEKSNSLQDINNIQPKSRCAVIFSYTKPIAFSRIQETYNVSYKLDGKPQTAQFSVEVEPNAPDNILKVLDNNFQQIQVVPGTEHTVQVRIVNPPNGKMATDLELERLKPSLWDGEIKLDNTNSTCVKNKTLAQGSSCFYNIILKPAASDINYQRQLVFKYKDNTNQLIELPFTLQGSIDVLKPGQTLTKPSVDTPIYVKSNAIVGDEFYSYGKRTKKDDAIANMSYPDAVTKRIPQDTWTGAQHVPWSFKNAWSTSQPTKLKDIIADREIIDGKRYIKLYHGSTSDAKNVFLGGANNIDFSLAGKVPGGLAAFGNGFYLSASMNESKNYACSSLKGKPGKAGLNGLLLVIGIEENDKLQGRPSAPSDSNGRAKNNDLYFATGQNNQFVFFDNIVPYLKILKVVELPASGFYMAKSIVENDGFAKDNSTPEDDLFQTYICKP